MHGSTDAASTVFIHPEFRSLSDLNDIHRTIRALLDGPDAASPVGSPNTALAATAAAAATVTSPSSASPPPLSARPRLLCVWDVDDTLVSSGAAGVRQCPVFDRDALHGLFRSLRGRARHLLLSQGSIDDVFKRQASGQLRHLLPYFAEENAMARRRKAHQGCGHFLWSNGHAERTEGREMEEAEAQIVRIATLHAPEEKPNDAAAFTDAARAPPRCPGDVRWLVMRPTLWGITLSALSNFIAPSPNTAFLDGTVFRKMDIVRSFAASGLWDAVFFIDNNVSELGIVRPGLGLDDYHRMKAAHKLPRFFQSEFLLLEASAKLAQTGTVPPCCCGSSSSSLSPSPAFTVVQEGKQQNGKINGVLKEAPNNKTKNREPMNKSDMAYLKREGQDCVPHDVCLLVAHLHLDGPTYHHITNFSHRSRAITNPIALSNGQRQPIFTNMPTCSDEQYEELLADFRQCEKALLDGAPEAGAAQPLCDWAPAANAVRHAVHPRPCRVPCLCHQYAGICHHIKTNLVEAISAGVTEAREVELKKEANHLYRCLIRRQPVIDPAFIAPLACVLFDILTGKLPLTRSVGDTLKKAVMELQKCSKNKSVEKRGG